jgi:hypothetical protein
MLLSLDSLHLKIGTHMFPMDSIPSILSGEIYNRIRTLVDLLTIIIYTNNEFEEKFFFS